MFALKLNSDENDGNPTGEKRMKALGERHHLNKGGLKVKQPLGLLHATNVPLEAPSNC